MSYILDALRKAEHERHLGQPPSLAALPPAQPTGQRLWLWLSLGLGLGFNAALLAYFLIQPKSAPEPAAPVATAPAGAPSPSTATARAPQTAPAPIPPPAAAPPVAPTDSGVSVNAATDRETAAPQAAPAPAPPAPPRKKATGNPVSTDPARPTNSASRERRREDSKPAAGPTVTIGPEPPPLLDTLPAAARRGLPELNLDIHVYSPKPDARFVVINGRRYREGDPVEKGAVLESVTPGGAVLRQGGQRFQLSVRR